MKLNKKITSTSKYEMEIVAVAIPEMPLLIGKMSALIIIIIIIKFLTCHNTENHYKGMPYRSQN